MIAKERVSKRKHWCARRGPDVPSFTGDGVGGQGDKTMGCTLKKISTTLQEG